MRRIAPGKRKTAWDYQSLLHTALRLWRRTPAGAAGGASVFQSLGRQIRGLLSKIWHLPDHYHWMEPLPYAHRRGVLIAIGILLLALLLPYTPPSVPHSPPTDSGPQQETAPLQANLTGEPAAPPSAARQVNWQRYQIASGQTLAQLFRDNNLPVSDVFAMAQVEGRERPLSDLRAGQEVRIQLNSQGMVARLEIDTTDNQTIRFIRQSDGAFQRRP
ncbi:Opacity-associated protein A [Affinibrenneria salicis]|uniref:Opacity-associated protein A n=1 Tax=Affinibrenneria salicis TaxID=2590031 RepID=A0A5J5FW57_9GAMM|nr:LysM-like peptidoglycan-binding domain-containing protein [Affinibrenneria salicis]KAA8997725.1 Opacity-associated protein A [Affinibrenneria salicis]